MKKAPLTAMCLALLVCWLGVATSARAQGDAEAEAKFIAMLKNASLKGTWAPVAGGRLGAEKGNDSYKIARVEKGAGGKWSVVSIFSVQGRDIEFPISCSVKFAGDTAVLILDD